MSHTHSQPRDHVYSKQVEELEEMVTSLRTLVGHGLVCPQAGAW